MPMFVHNVRAFTFNLNPWRDENMNLRGMQRPLPQVQVLNVL
jgi:hypothetical protein